ncbi:hypothetical protein FRC02_007726 [Tulasnella sp. 418]|nr:hypothetical protein FRC02_007726 [Tulasnella sp. 418]
MAHPDEKIRTVAMDYFLGHFSEFYAAKYDHKDFADLAYVPAVRPGGTVHMSKPSDVYADPECAVMGFSVVKTELREVALSKLRIRDHPSTQSILNVLLETPPSTPQIAQSYFGYLARRIADFSETDYVVLRQAPIIPVVPVTGDLSPNGGLSLTMAKPCECIFKNSSFSTTHAKLFMAVDFGSKASIFLTACGIKDRPDMKDIITLLLQDPERFLKAVGSIDVYLEELRNIAAYQECPKDLTERMRTTPFLVGRLRMVQSSHGSDINESTMEGDIAIIDDINAHSLFSDLVYVSPEEETLEAFYLKLGSPRLTSLIAEECEPRSIEVLESSLSAQIRSLILERACLLLHEQGVRAKVEVEWLSLHKNFVVRCCGSLE